MAKRSFRVAALFGIMSIFATITLGDALGYFDGKVQPSKLAAMEALWEQEPAPAGFNLFAIPSQSAQKNYLQIKIPYVLTPLVTHTLRTELPGIKEIRKDSIGRIENGIPALLALQKLSRDPQDEQALEQFKAHQMDLGYAFLLQRYSPEQDVSKATAADIERAATDTVPYVPAIFWSFRFMVGAGFTMLILLIFSAYYSLRNMVQEKRKLLVTLVWLIPLPFLACEAGWITAEVGRQPWAVFGMLPTWNAASSHSFLYMLFSLSGFVLLYSIFIVVEMVLMFKYARLGPSSDDSEQKTSEGRSRDDKGSLGLA